MFNNSNIDLFAASIDGELPQTPRKSDNPYKTVFSPRALSGDICFTPSAWTTPVCPQAGETPFKLGTPQTNLFGTPGAYRAAASPSWTPRGMPGLQQTPLGSIGVTPARVMGPFPRRDLFFEATPSPSPASVITHRKIYTPMRLREKLARDSLEERNGLDLLDASLFGMAEASNHSPTTTFSQNLVPHAGLGALEAAPTSLAISIPPPRATSPPLEAAPIQGNVGELDGMDSNGEEADTGEDGEREGDGVTYHTQSSTDIIHSQPGAQNETTDNDGNVWLPFPYGRDSLVTYLERGLSLRYLFPSSIHGGRIRCGAELELVGGLWRRTDRCNESKGSLESYQRHIKSKHLGVKRGKEVGLVHIVNTVWGCSKTLPRQPNTCLRVQRWVPNLPGFQLAA